jgi:hypothetical protein
VIEVGGSGLEDSCTGVYGKWYSRKRNRRGGWRPFFGSEQPADSLSTVSSDLRDDVVLVVPSAGSLMSRQRRRLNENAKKAVLLEGLPPAPS